MDKICYIAARTPTPGQVKTRLAASIGDLNAASLYAGFLRDLEAKLSRVSFPVCWYVTPGDWAGRPHREQGAGDWTSRQARLFQDAAARGEERVVLIASDSPHIDVAVIHEAFAELAHKEIVLGPVDDGGYYLLGMRGWHDVFRGVEMTSPTTTAEIVKRARALAISVAFTDTLFDVDDVGDLERLIPLAQRRPDLANTRKALLSLAARMAA